MTRKDYMILADAVRRTHEEAGLRGASVVADVAHTAIDSTAHAIAHACQKDNPSFDRNRFLLACGVPR